VKLVVDFTRTENKIRKQNRCEKGEQRRNSCYWRAQRIKGKLNTKATKESK
jgi:hypothetical protein